MSPPIPTLQFERTFWTRRLARVAGIDVAGRGARVRHNYSRRSKNHHVRQAVHDLQIFQTDLVATKQTIYGDLIASGWLTISLMMRLFTNNFLYPVFGFSSQSLVTSRYLLPRGHLS